MAEKKAVTGATVERYRRSGKREKGQILDEFVKLTEYNRAYARWLLRGGKKKGGVGRRRRWSRFLMTQRLLILSAFPDEATG